MTVSTVPANDRNHPSIAPDLSFASVFHADTVMVLGERETKLSVVAKLVQRLSNTGRLGVNQTNEIIHRITFRESLASTAFGRGLAFPHLRTPHVKNFIGSIAILPSGVPFDSNDGAETKLVFLTLSPYASREHHTQLLSRLVSLLSNKAAAVQLIKNENATAFHRTLCRFDAR
ncbi:PTS sugar transporter subunit IIA [Rubripirellula reticaptiva]|uniref:PTS system fructose-specific EIIABC component n=1 Tax=Rubripirellula reticaptiva TaxID=2528013 RepID=A0A5C6EH27_9BACT|nr:PTS sugar transporter subunit IIA [Rubripirellula reticaptiva]TWU47021.1 PTS system fructose-specific EIIABC component [Rubripirellula reticaptiva]